MYLYRCGRSRIGHRLRSPITQLLHFTEASEIDNEAVSYVGIQHTFIRFVDLLNRDDLDISRDVVTATEVQHVLGFTDTADKRPSQPSATHD